MTNYDAIVLGTGGVGSAAAAQLARRGCRVLGLDRFPGGHNHGSSHGKTRIIRKAYFEHPAYVPLLHRGYELWRELEDRCGERLYDEVGLIEVGPSNGVVIPGVLQAAREHSLAVESLSTEDFAERFPGFVLPADELAVFEREAGYLFVEQCVLAHLSEAVKCGAELRIEEPVVEWRADGNTVTVRTNKNQYEAAALVVTAGPWSAEMLAGLDIPLQVVRKHLHWYGCDDQRYRADHGCPGFFYERPDGYFYGFPAIDELGVKIAEHSGGVEVANPLDDDKSIDRDDRTRIEDFLASHLPGVSSTSTAHDVCYYTRTPDEHFIVDRHPDYSNVAFVAGLSGHGFKFASVLGEVLADLTVRGETDLPIDFLSVDRFA